MDWNNCTTTVNGEKVATAQCIIPFLQSLISAAFMFAGSVAAIVLIIGGIKYVLSRGDQAKLKSAQQTITWGVVGLVIIILAFAIVTFIGSVTGTNNSCIFKGLFGGNIRCT